MIHFNHHLHSMSEFGWKIQPPYTWFQCWVMWFLCIDIPCDSIHHMKRNIHSTDQKFNWEIVCHSTILTISNFIIWFRTLNIEYVILSFDDHVIEDLDYRQLSSICISMLSSICNVLNDMIIICEYRMIKFQCSESYDEIIGITFCELLISNSRWILSEKHGMRNVVNPVWKISDSTIGEHCDIIICIIIWTIYFWPDLELEHHHVSETPSYHSHTSTTHTRYDIIQTHLPTPHALITTWYHTYIPKNISEIIK